MDELRDNMDPSNTFSSSEICSDDYLNCALCGQALKFTHQIDYISLSIKEEAHCSCCKIKLKSRDYTMQ